MAAERLTLLFLLLACVLHFPVGSLRTYRGYKLFQVTPTTDAHANVLRQLKEESHEMEFLTGLKRNRVTTFVVPPSETSWAHDLLVDHGMKIKTSDLQSLLDRERQRVRSRFAYAKAGRTKPPLSHDDYRDLDEVDKSLGRNPEKRVIIVEALTHAREWIAGAAILYVIDQLLYQYKMNDGDARRALDMYKWIFVPVANPDGYHHTWAEDRMWRKNRRQMHGCVGVDINRNYNIDFKGTEKRYTRNCKTCVYAGPEPFSEPESQNIKHLVESNLSRLQAFVPLHSFQQALFAPWGFTKERPTRHEELDRVGKLMLQTLLSFGKKYEYGISLDLLGYPVSGDAADWVFSMAPWSYTYVYELRPGNYSSCTFILPPEEIVPTGKEVYASLMTMVREMKPVETDHDEDN
ncbi:hypothetical protein BaRGS_00015022 [Batillaria attramentaria]|uniref:Peptidase M14 domain-containing protein n=1 Tax=Batillaria attramentaria TaxID=370345 RepID=A0ABD0L2Z5_9CAEN